MRIGICERGWARAGVSTAQTIDELLRIAVHVERAGFTKLWLTEHHTKAYSWTFPDALVPLVGRATRTLGVGIGGVLIASRNPYRTALDLSLLDRLFPGRFELGVGRTTALRNHACLSGLDVDPNDPVIVTDYLTRAATLFRCLGLPVAGPPSMGPRDADFALPVRGPLARLPWLLGMSLASMRLAARWGLPFGCIDHPGAPTVVADYRATFRPSAWLARPRVLVSVIGIGGATVEDAMRSSPEGGSSDSADIKLSDLAFARSDTAARFERVAERYAADELVYTDCCPDPARRLETYDAIAEQVIGPGAAAPPRAAVTA